MGSGQGQDTHLFSGFDGLLQLHAPVGTARAGGPPFAPFAKGGIPDPELPAALAGERKPPRRGIVICSSFDSYTETYVVLNLAFLALAVMTQSYIPYRHDAEFLQEHFFTVFLHS